MDKIRALIVDDSSVMRKIVERSLRQAGIELEKVLEASNGAEALVALQDNAVDLILCDINMPVMDGLEFVRQVAHGGERQRRSDRHDHHRRQRIACGAGAFRWRSRIHPQAVHSRSGQRARFALAGAKTMSTDAAFAKLAREENWLPILELAVEEVFEIMLGCQVKPVPPRRSPS